MILSDGKNDLQHFLTEVRALTSAYVTDELPHHDRIESQSFIERMGHVRIVHLLCRILKR